MVSISQLQKIKPSELEEAADGWHKVSSVAGDAKHRVDNEIVGRLQRDLAGKAPAAALDRLRRLSRNFHYTQVETGLIRTALNGLASELRAAQRKLNDAIADAEAEKFTVKPDGTVHWVSQQMKMPFNPEQTAWAGGPKGVLAFDSQQAKAQAYADRIGAAIADATKADDHYSRTLDRLKAGNDLEVTDSDWADAQRDTSALRRSSGKYLQRDDIPKGKSPAENSKWWQGLSVEERGEYSSLFPAEIGALDGLPATVRDDANRTVLDESQARLRLELDHLGPEPPEYDPGDGNSGPYVSKKWEEWHKKHDFLKAQLRGMTAIQKRFDLTGFEGLPPAYLLGFDAEGKGRAIIATGNPDTAKHTAVYVPGTGARLAGAEGDIARMTDLWYDSQQFAGGDELSTITWIGYDAPRSAFPGDKGDAVPEASSVDWANDAAPHLNRFMEGLHTAQGGADASHTTLIGHSYGSTVIGDASLGGRMATDDILVAGSPGMLVPEAEDLGIGKEHVWSEAASSDKDPVPLGGKIAGLGGWKWGAQYWHGIPYSYGPQEVVPSDEAFGAHRMSTDSQDHSGYWKRDSASLWNQAAVATGNYDRVKYD
ncbi:alpha/beta hydrolase [Streptomyces sp. DSM 41527]|uniref:Alpha/beta hydrolase n=1 Tax=Streptomyces mooreae TaxID=3075523 RepID=A0ABU2T506_9ACTN|nr:alpha/beta hydrolase [Streptomyces sp. DSM 41527]MDT0456298.1 alpha/beta hydrolase [Streptomyces sp. DSM 41527]